MQKPAALNTSIRTMSHHLHHPQNMMMHPPRLPMIRRRSLSRLKVELDIQQLHSFIVHHLCGTKSVVITGAASTAVAIQNQLRVGVPPCREELLDCASIITDFISTTTTTSTNASSSSAQETDHGLSSGYNSSLVVFEAHSLVGCIHAKLKRHKRAAGSFLRALWIASIAHLQIPEEEVALTMHRLAKAYGTPTAVVSSSVPWTPSTGANATNSCDRQDAIKLLETAISKYTAAGLWLEHSVVVDARKLLVKYTAAATEHAAQMGNLNSLLVDPNSYRRSSSN